MLADRPKQARRYATLGKNSVIEIADREKIRDDLTDLIREGPAAGIVRQHGLASEADVAGRLRELGAA